MNSKLFDLEEIDFEVAIETMGRLIAIQSKKIFSEQNKSHCDKRKLRKYLRNRAHMQAGIGKLYAGDKLTLNKVNAIYLPRVAAALRQP